MLAEAFKPDSQLAILFKRSLSTLYSVLYFVNDMSRSAGEILIGTGIRVRVRVGANGVGVSVGLGDGVGVFVKVGRAAYVLSVRGLIIAVGFLKAKVSKIPKAKTVIRGKRIYSLLACMGLYYHILLFLIG